MMTNKFTPTVAEIREVSSEIANGKQISGAEAWEVFIRYISLYSTREDYIRLKSEYPLVYEIVKQVGGRELLTGNPSFVRPEFEKIYNKAMIEVKEQQILPSSFINQLQDFRGSMYKQLEINSFPALGGDISD
jgi:hypothetical protein